MIHETLQSGGYKPAGFEDAGLNAINPFWKNLPYCDIFFCMTPDLLHQLHKGSAEADVVKAVQAVLDFIFYAHFETHTEESLSRLDEAWTSFHVHKQVFVRLGLRKDFNGIPKLHSMTHYIESIRLLGTADGYNSKGLNVSTSTSPRLVIARAIGSRLYLAAAFGSGGEEENGEDDEDDGGEDIDADLSLGVSAARGDNNKYKISRKPTFPNTSVKTIVDNFCSPLGSSTKVFDFIVSFGNHWHSADNIPICVFPLFY
ncbi:hypothetical protein BC835DRAFT_1413399 [Cytidiella melzeri]|nr:hypothetical protein BC835DRAFT_1413399 [Cytidiella melzeri]